MGRREADWGIGSSTYFWTDNSVGGIPLRTKFPRLFALASDRWVTAEKMARRGWEEGEPLGSGGGPCWHGRRRVCRSVLLCFMILFCRIVFLTGGGGYLIPLMVI